MLLLRNFLLNFTNSGPDITSYFSLGCVLVIRKNILSINTPVVCLLFVCVGGIDSFKRYTFLYVVPVVVNVLKLFLVLDEGLHFTFCSFLLIMCLHISLRFIQKTGLVVCCFQATQHLFIFFQLVFACVCCWVAHVVALLILLHCLCCFAHLNYTIVTSSFGILFCCSLLSPSFCYYLWWN